MKDMYPVKIRFSIAYDKIVTQINKSKAIGMDGPAFHKARNGLVQMKNTDYSVIQLFSDDIQGIELLNQSMLILNGNINKWKYNTYIIFTGLLNKKSINDLVEEAAISERGVYKIMKTNNLKECVKLIELIHDEITKAVLPKK
jgi:hypothetical protein